MDFKIRFWGVRGSIASPGAATQLVGGNTSCVEVRCGETLLILDAGTGLRALGEQLAKQGETQFHLLLSHLHWDHIQGLPFFAPLYLPKSELRVYGPGAAEHSLRRILAHQMMSPVFPVELEQLASRIDTIEVGDGARFSIADVNIRVARLNHPGGVLAYRIDYAGSSMVYATDTEHGSGIDPTLVDLARHADVLIYDAQYTPEEYYGSPGLGSKVGWGHSTYEEGARVAEAARVGRLVLFHHDPRRTDQQVSDLAGRARESFADTVAAREGMCVDVACSRVA